MIIVPAWMERKRTPTLVKWWRELNAWGWPEESKEFGEPEEPGRGIAGNPRRQQWMEMIQIELGRRVILKPKQIVKVLEARP